MRYRVLKHRLRQRGASALEFALALLVFLTLFLGLIDLTRLV